jgi:glycosyltransferase involved in cell wall biosynthesis
LLRTLSYYRRGIAEIRRLRPRVVHCNDYNTMWIGVAAKLLTRSALVYDSHELWPDRNGRSEPRWWLLACEALFLRVADRNLATSPGHADAIARRHRVAPPRVVRNIAERPAANGAAAGSGGERPAASGSAGPGAERPGEPRTIVYAGAATEGRGLEQAIAALPHAPGIALRILGPGRNAYCERLGLLATRHGVAERVRIEAPVPPQRVVAEIAGAAAGLALIQPACLSYALSLPNKLFEYLAAGLPILAADVPTIAAFVERHDVGLIVPPDEPEEIARAMLEIVEPERNRHLRVAVAETAARLSWEREAEGLKRAYREATAAAGGWR